MTASPGLAERLEEVRGRIDRAARASGRSPSDVCLVAVSKTFPVDVIQAVLELGVEDLGENRAQEFKEKSHILGPRARWHFIGHLQTNKTRHVTGAHLIHSVDRSGLAEALDRRARRAGLVQSVLLEVNVSGEAAKHGVEPARLTALANEVASFDGIEVKGLMAMAPATDDPARSRPYFAALKELSEEVTRVIPAATELSMGMTNDYEVAISEGATIVRVGRAIFGSRGKP